MTHTVKIMIELVKENPNIDPKKLLQIVAKDVPEEVEIKLLDIIGLVKSAPEIDTDRLMGLVGDSLNHLKALYTGRKYGNGGVHEGSHWTPSDEAFLIEKTKEGQRTEYIADKLGRTKSAVSQRRWQLRKSGRLGFYSRNKAQKNELELETV